MRKPKEKDYTGMTEEEIAASKARSEAARLMGQKGGKARVAKLTPEQLSAAGKKGGATTKARHGLAHYQKIGLAGGIKRHADIMANDPEFYSREGKRGGAMVKAAVEAAKAAEAREAAETEGEAGEDQQP
jgi:general stress protein YciG